MFSRGIGQIFGVAAVAVLLSAAQSAFAHGVVVGQNSSGDLVVHIEVHQPIELPPSIFPGILGWANAEPGIASAELDEPDEDLFQLDDACSVQFIFVGADPGIQIVTSHVWVPGESLEFGPPFFDDHLVFNIPDGEIGTSYAVQFRLHDLNGVHGDSEVYEIRFTPVDTVCHCRGDTDENDLLTGSDLQPFIDCMMSSPPEGPIEKACSCADIDGDGALDDLDIEMFVDRLLAEAGCD